MLATLGSNVTHTTSPVAPSEVRGTWLTTTANEAISSPSNTSVTMKRLREIGLNTVYVEIWKNGYTEFPSNTAKKFTNSELRINPSPSGAIQRDLLQETLIEAHRNGLIYIAWFEYGFMAAHQSTQNELRARKDWLSLDQKGNEVAKNGFVWLNPLHPDAQSLLLGIVKDAIKKYDLDGIQLDDRIVWPYIDMGYDEFTQNLYAKEHNGNRPPLDVNDSEWVAWRTRKVEDFSKRFVREIRAAGGKDFIISLSPGPHPWAKENYLIDWPAWSKWTNNPTWDEYIPQVYRMNYPSFQRDWYQQVEFMGNRKTDLIAGVRLVGDGPEQSRNDVTKHAELTRATQTGGHCWWFSRGVLDVFPNELANFYNVPQNGQAPHPRFGSQWRPLPIKATRVGTSTKWRATLTHGKWQLIAKIAGAWQPIKTVIIDAKSKAKTTVNTEEVIHNAEAVEYLLQRK